MFQIADGAETKRERHSFGRRRRRRVKFFSPSLFLVEREFETEQKKTGGLFSWNDARHAFAGRARRYRRSTLRKRRGAIECELREETERNPKTKKKKSNATTKKKQSRDKVVGVVGVEFFFLSATFSATSFFFFSGQLTKLTRLFSFFLFNTTKKQIQSAEDTALNAFSAFKNLQLGESCFFIFFSVVFFFFILL